MTEVTTMIVNKEGIHARPASVFVQTASKFKSRIWIEAKGKTVDAKSILMIMSMGLLNGTSIIISADGYDEVEALMTLRDLVDSGFGETIDETVKKRISKEKMQQIAKEKGLKFRRAGN